MITEQVVISEKTHSTSKEEQRRAMVRKCLQHIKKLKSSKITLLQQNKELLNHGLFNMYKDNCLKISHMTEQIFLQNKEVNRLETLDVQPD